MNAVGRSFGVFKLRPRGHAKHLPEIDVSIPRRDSNTGPGHKGIVVQGDPYMPIEEAVTRRDLTINALMVDVLTRELCDIVGGLTDLRDGTLRAVDARTFLDDPLRALRVVQFAARTGFTPNPPLLDLCRQAPLHELPAERVQIEWGKLLLKGRDVAAGLQIARTVDLGARIFPEQVDDEGLDDVLQRAVAHRDGLDGPGPRWVLMVVLWLARTPLAAAERTLNRLNLHTVARYPVRKQILGLLHTAERPAVTDADLRHLSTEVEVRLALLFRAALDPEIDLPAALDRATSLGVLLAKPAPLLRGRDLAALGVRGGPAMGALLERAYRAQLDGELQSLTDALAWATRALEA